MTIFKAIVGSRAYGTDIETSDTDYKGVYMQNIDDLISFGYKEQKEIGKDECYYELRRFMQLLQTANPTVLELLYSPEDCILETSPQFQLLQEHRDKFLTKKCLLSFGGYAIAQIKKAKGLDKKMNWEKSKIIRKTPMDFCYIFQEGKSVSLAKWLKKESKVQEFCGLVGLEHFRDCYALYYDYGSQYGTEITRNTTPLGFRGITMDDGNSVRTSSVPKNHTCEGIVYYNKDGYSMHCKDYKDYETWQENRNTQRYVDSVEHGQKIDGKNLLHCRRLLDMAIEIATTETITVRRPNKDYLLSIRRGEVKLDAIIEEAERDIKNLDELFKKSNLPEECDIDFVNGLLIKIRKL